MKYLHYLFLVLALLPLTACVTGLKIPQETAQSSAKNDKPTRSSINKPQTEPIAGNEYLDLNSSAAFIKKEAKEPVWIGRDSSVITGINPEDISQEVFKGKSFLLLPKDHPFAKDFIANPFKDLNKLLPVRASIWGQELTLDKVEMNSVLFKIAGEIPPPDFPSVTDAELKAMFGDYKKQILGEGGQGIVYNIAHLGQEYALKKNASEAFNMEKLQFTGGVAKIYAMFKLGDEPWMIMEKGQETLAKLNTRKAKLNDEQVIDASNRFIKLIQAQKALNIANTDNKPENLLLTKANQLVVIDISADASTKGYSKGEAQALARALLENNQGLELRGGHIFLDKYYEHNQAYRDQMVASPDVLRFWSKIKCLELMDEKRKTNCATVNNFEDLFNLLTKADLLPIAERVNHEYKNLSGTHDSKPNYMYQTELPMPNVQEISEADWTKYFDQRYLIGQKFCRHIADAIEQNDYTGTTNKHVFFFPLAESYQPLCKKMAGNKLMFDKEFTSATNPEFRQWIEVALSPSIKLETFKQLSRYYVPRSDIDVFIIRNLYPTDSLVARAIMSLLKFEG